SPYQALMVRSATNRSTDSRSCSLASSARCSSFASIVTSAPFFGSLLTRNRYERGLFLVSLVMGFLLLQRYKTQLSSQQFLIRNIIERNTCGNDVTRQRLGFRPIFRVGPDIAPQGLGQRRRICGVHRLRVGSQP